MIRRRAALVTVWIATNLVNVIGPEPAWMKIAIVGTFLPSFAVVVKSRWLYGAPVWGR